MITINGVKFAKNDEELTNSLFETGGTCIGTYKVTKTKITLFNLQGVKIGVINSHGVLCKATQHDVIGSYTKGNWRYTYGTPEGIPEYTSFMKKHNDMKQILRDNNIKYTGEF